jgi:hypothetical protein
VKDYENGKKIIEDVLKKYHKGDPNKKIANED